MKSYIINIDGVEMFYIIWCCDIFDGNYILNKKGGLNSL